MRLRRGICANLPSPESGIEVDADMLDKLPYLDAVCEEVLRVYPPVGNWGKVARRDTEIGGVKIPKGTTARASIMCMNKARYLWGEDARVFNPERWLSGDHKTICGAKDGVFTKTFGYGSRMCIGRSNFYCFKFLELTTDC
jgi:cytochrome P450